MLHSLVRAPAHLTNQEGSHHRRAELDKHTAASFTGRQRCKAEPARNAVLAMDEHIAVSRRHRRPDELHRFLELAEDLIIVVMHGNAQVPGSNFGRTQPKGHNEGALACQAIDDASRTSHAR